MTYGVIDTNLDNETIYGTSDGIKSCIDADPEFQQWLRDNQDSLPDDIQAKIDDGTLTIADAD